MTVGKKSDAAVSTHSGRAFLRLRLQVISYVLHMQIFTDVPNDFISITKVSFDITFKNNHADSNCKSKISMEEPKTFVQPIPEDIKNREK